MYQSDKSKTKSYLYFLVIFLNAFGQKGHDFKVFKTWAQDFFPPWEFWINYKYSSATQGHIFKRLVHLQNSIVTFYSPYIIFIPWNTKGEIFDNFYISFPKKEWKKQRKLIFYSIYEFLSLTSHSLLKMKGKKHKYSYNFCLKNSTSCGQNFRSF